MIPPGSPMYIFKVTMATNPSLAGNPLNKANVDWWEAEKARIESIRRKPKLVAVDEKSP